MPRVDGAEHAGHDLLLAVGVGLEVDDHHHGVAVLKGTREKETIGVKRQLGISRGGRGGRGRRTSNANKHVALVIHQGNKTRDEGRKKNKPRLMRGNEKAGKKRQRVGSSMHRRCKMSTPAIRETHRDTQDEQRYQRRLRKMEAKAREKTHGESFERCARGTKQNKL